jgi:3-deoxy-7-phosphoheptulonate synthase
MSTLPLLPAAAARPGVTVRVAIGGAVFGGLDVPVIAGPCSVEHGYVDHAGAAAAAGAAVLRGCVRKPRTRPDSFQGLGEAGMPLLAEARRRTGLPVLAEPLDAGDVGMLIPHVDALLVGARSMQNTPLLRAVGRANLPVVLKRGLAATYDEWLGAADYILAEGNTQVVLCERGIRTFETATRNTLDVASIPVLRDRTTLPIIVDPSHAAGRAGWVLPLALAAVAAGADGLLVECHPTPTASWSDAAQALDMAGLRRLVDAIDVLVAAVRPADHAGPEGLGAGVTAVDFAIGRLLQRRDQLIAQAAASARGAVENSPRGTVGAAI